jgi:hypothetical protein
MNCVAPICDEIFFSIDIELDIGSDYQCQPIRPS